MTSLTMYTTTTNSTVLTTGRTLVTTLDSPATNPTSTKCGNVSTGYGQVYGQTNTTGWGNAGAGYGGIQAPNGGGFILEPAQLSLAGQQFPAGAWAMRWRSKCSVGTLAVDMYVPVYKYNISTLAYASLFTFSLLGQTLTTTATNLDFGNINEALVNVNTNETLYFETWLNINTNSTGSSAATVSVVESISTSVGFTGSTWLLTPGYQSQSMTAFFAQRRRRLGRVG